MIQQKNTIFALSKEERNHIFIELANMAHITLVLTFLTILPFVNFVYGVKGQNNVKRAFEVACAGGHNILLIGSPGSGKSMMAKRLPSILPPLSLAEALETTKIHSVAGSLKSGTTLLTTRPYRAPHHQSSDAGGWRHISHARGNQFGTQWRAFPRRRKAERLVPFRYYLYLYNLIY